MGWFKKLTRKNGGKYSGKSTIELKHLQKGRKVKGEQLVYRKKVITLEEEQNIQKELERREREKKERIRKYDKRRKMPTGLKGYTGSMTGKKDFFISYESPKIKDKKSKTREDWTRMF